MSKKSEKYQEIDKLLQTIFSEHPSMQSHLSLQDRFDERLAELQITATAALEILNMERRTLKGILDGTQKRIDFIALSKIATFLDLSTIEVVKLYLSALHIKHGADLEGSQKRDYIIRNFDLAVLKKVGFIENISDFDHIETQIKSFFGLQSIFEYVSDNIDAAFSSGKIKPKNLLTRKFWIQTAAETFKQINNNHDFDRQALVEYFPKIRWHSTVVDKGMFLVIRSLYMLGVTVIFQESLPTLHLRGATFSINSKPCIVITDYRGFYSSLWFALIHELYHVLFHWDEIKLSTYHISDDDNDLFVLAEKEKEADDFAREYLCSKEKTAAAVSHIEDPSFIERYAEHNHIHYSFIYVFHAWDLGKEDRYAWARAHKHNPDISLCLNPLIKNPWQQRRPIREVARERRLKLYNL